MPILLSRPETKQAVKPLTHPITVAFGLANLYLLDLTGPLISTEHDLVYHLVGSASSVIVPIIVYLITLSLLLTALLYLAERPGPLRVIIWSAFLLALPSILLHTIANFAGIEISDWITYIVAVVCLLVFIAISLLWKRFLPRFEAIQRAAAAILGIFAFTGILIFVQLVWSGWQARNLNPAPTLHQSQQAATQHLISAFCGFSSTNSPTSNSTSAVFPASNFPPSIDSPRNPRFLPTLFQPVSIHAISFPRFSLALLRTL